jgi:hypothetical protein
MAVPADAPTSKRQTSAPGASEVEIGGGRQASLKCRYTGDLPGLSGSHPSTSGAVMSVWRACRTFPGLADGGRDPAAVGDVDGVASSPVSDLGWGRTGLAFRNRPKG